MSNRTVLYVSGFGSALRAKDLAWEFERYGRLIRCDIPAPKTPSSTPYHLVLLNERTESGRALTSPKAFAFIEFRYERDAEDAYYDMHGRAIDGRRITVQWAKRPPSAQWRHDGAPGPDRRERAPEPDRRRSPPRRRSPSPVRRDDRDGDRRRSLSPRRDEDRNGNGNGHKSASPSPTKIKTDDQDVVSGDRRDRDAGDI